MTLNEVKSNFRETKKGNALAAQFLIDYFINNVERQLNNLDFDNKEKIEKSIKCKELIIRNIHAYYDENKFIEGTLNDIKNIIYLNEKKEINGTKDIIDFQRYNIASKIDMNNLKLKELSSKEYELIRLYYVENKNIDELSEIFKCTKTIIYVRLRRITEKIINQNLLNKMSNEEIFIYTK